MAMSNEEAVNALAEAVGINLEIRDQLPCKYLPRNCLEVFSNNRDRDHHEEICEYQPISCIVKFNRCTERIPFNALEDHIQNEHRMTISENNVSLDKINNDNNIERMFSSFYRFDGKIFMFRIDEIEGRYYPAVFLLTTVSGGVDKYQYEITMSDLKLRKTFPLWHNHCLSSKSLYFQFQSNATCPIPGDLIRNDGLHDYTLKVSLSIIPPIDEGNELTCTNTRNGCREILPNEEQLRYHENICEYQITNCVFKWNKCHTIQLVYNQLIQHIRGRHGVQFLNNGTTCDKIRAGKIKGPMLTSFYAFDGRHFMFRIDEISRNRYPAVFLLTPDTVSPSKYKYQITMNNMEEDLKPVPTWTGYCISYKIPFPKFPAINPIQQIPNELIEENDLIDYKLTVTIYSTN